MEWFSVPAGEAAIDLVVSTLLRGGVLSVLLFAAVRLLGRTSPAVRAAWCATGALAVLSLPLLARLLPGWQFGPFASPVTALADPLAAGLGAGAPVVGGALVAIWGAGVALLLGRLALQLGRVIALTRRGETAADGRLDRLARMIEREAGVSHDVRVVLSSAVRVPCTWGVRRPVVLLPPEATAWPVELQRAVLHHEIAHVARRDYLGLIWLELVRVFHWPNPFIWLLHGTGRHEQERACDDAAVRAGIPPVEYARHLVTVGRHAVRTDGSPLAVLPMVRARSFRARVASMLEPAADRRPATRSRLVLTGVVIALLAASVAIASPTWLCPAQAGPGTATAAAPRAT